MSEVVNKILLEKEDSSPKEERQKLLDNERNLLLDYANTLLNQIKSLSDNKHIQLTEAESTNISNWLLRMQALKSFAWSHVNNCTVHLIFLSDIRDFAYHSG